MLLTLAEYKASWKGRADHLLGLYLPDHSDSGEDMTLCRAWTIIVIPKDVKHLPPPKLGRIAGKKLPRTTRELLYSCSLKVSAGFACLNEWPSACRQGLLFDMGN